MTSALGIFMLLSRYPQHLLLLRNNLRVACNAVRSSVFVGNLAPTVYRIVCRARINTFVFTAHNNAEGNIFRPPPDLAAPKWNSDFLRPLSKTVFLPRLRPHLLPTLSPLRTAFLIFNLENKNLSNDPDSSFILNGLQPGFKLISLWLRFRYGDVATRPIILVPIVC